ncbi:MAG TPA: molybdopterin cofactor-binding domain-containing protein [Syntrophorhabdaceae bacterium]|nr:molybdopterin cofactor-binding domain-containing protein [Syntrophorhabdaceae bacterium]
MKKDTANRSWADSGEKAGVVSRRDFLKTVGGGIAILFFAGTLPAQQAERRAIGQQLPTDFNAFLRIGADGRVSCFTGKIEMGQGVVTSLSQMLADELDVPHSRVDMVMGDTDLCPWDMGTFGSMSTRFFGPPLREAAAEARSVLLALASESLKVPQSRLTVKDGVVSDKMNSAKKISYQELTKGKYIERHLGRKPKLKEVAELKVMGKGVNRKDGMLKVTGEARYAADMRLPGMLYAKVLRPPAHGAKLKRFDASALKDVPDVRIVEDRDLVAVLHPEPDAAEKCLSLIKAEFDIPDSTLDNTTIHKHLLEAAPKEGEVVSSGGDLERGEGLAVQIFDETYQDYYVAHATIETHAALARIERDRITIWASTQTPFRGKEEIARVLGVPPDRVRIIAPFVGGGFGGKSFNLQAVEAARLAKLTGRPVQVMWSRKEAFFNDTFRPASIIKIKSGLDRDGRIIFWRYDVYYAGPRGAEQLYAVPHHKETSYVHYTGTPGTHPFATGAWRAPGNNSNSFARESQIDTMAANLNMDPLEFRIKNLTDARMINTLKAAAAQFGYKPAKAPSGRGYGVACAADAGACVAVMAEVDVNRATGKVSVKRIVCAQDMGFVVNPEGARLQIEGGLTMGLGYALSEEVNFKGGRILHDNFDTYDIPRFSWLPRIETILVDNPTHPAEGGGEPPITCVGAVIANAIFDAAGARLHQMPMTPARVKEAMGSIKK